MLVVRHIRSAITAAAMHGVFSVLVASPALAQQPPAPAAKPPAPCSAPEHRQFDFWVGDWEVTTPDGKPAGSNLITRELGGCVLHEHWKGRGGMLGESFNVYSPATRKWHQTWVDDRGTLLLLDGAFENGAMLLRGAERTVAGKPTLDRITWTPKGGDEVHQVWEQSNDGGRAWSTVFHGVYRRRK
jgi:hypothetical protein